MSTVRTVGGVGLAAAAAVAGYWLYEKRHKTSSHPVRGWMLKMKGDVLEKLEEVRDLNRDTYQHVVDQVAFHYRNAKKAGGEELDALVRDLKDDWDEFSHKLIAGKG